MTALNFFVILSLKYCDFYSESGRHNPYKVVLISLGSTSIHFNVVLLLTVTMSYHQELTLPRIEKFGGPFTTEQVEDVKTFLRILFSVRGPWHCVCLGCSNFKHCFLSIWNSYQWRTVLCT